jgi:hypothetical protein
VHDRAYVVSRAAIGEILQIPALSLVLSTLVLVIFSLYLLYDLNRIIRGGETNYVMATTGVYISLLNIFSSLLHPADGLRRRERLMLLQPQKKRLRAPFLFPGNPATGQRLRSTPSRALAAAACAPCTSL